MLNKSRGNMYEWVSHTWNPISGRCMHNCSYCYLHDMFGAFDKEPQLKEHCLKDNLGLGNKIFVGSATDMWGDWVNSEWIQKVLSYCKKFDNTYLFQTKNPLRFSQFWFNFPPKTILGTTLESNIQYDFSKSLFIDARAKVMMEISKKFDTMISIEPILKFEHEHFVDMIKKIGPQFVSIGADSKCHNLPEPKGGDIIYLIKCLEEFTEVRQKHNLRRLL